MLRNNPALARIHSNVSARRIIEQELQKQIKETSNVYTQSK
jgi:Fe-S cluster biogenesis protein NfuA